MILKGKLKNIEEQILVLKSEINSNKNNDVWLQYGGKQSPMIEQENLQLLSKLDKLETQRKFFLDHRESWMPKTIWNVIVPVLVTIITLYFVKLLGLN